MAYKYFITIIFPILFSYSAAHECIELNPNDYGVCAMVLGIGWTSEGCIYISGCDWKKPFKIYFNPLQ